MLEKLETWVKTVKDDKIKELYKAYQNTAQILEQQKIEILCCLTKEILKLPEFESLMTKALGEIPSEPLIPSSYINNFAALALPFESSVPVVKKTEGKSKPTEIKNGKDFKNLRTSNFLTQAQAAEKSGISLSLLRKWEQKKCAIPTKYASKINKLKG